MDKFKTSEYALNRVELGYTAILEIAVGGFETFPVFEVLRKLAKPQEFFDEIFLSPDWQLGNANFFREFLYLKLR